MAKGTLGLVLILLMIIPTSEVLLFDANDVWITLDGGYNPDVMLVGVEIGVGESLSVCYGDEYIEVCRVDDMPGDPGPPGPLCPNWTFNIDNYRIYWDSQGLDPEPGEWACLRTRECTRYWTGDPAYWDCVWSTFAIEIEDLVLMPTIIKNDFICPFPCGDS